MQNATPVAGFKNIFVDNSVPPNKVRLFDAAVTLWGAAEGKHVNVFPVSAVFTQKPVLVGPDRDVIEIRDRDTGELIHSKTCPIKLFTAVHAGDLKQTLTDAFFKYLYPQGVFAGRRFIEPYESPGEKARRQKSPEDADATMAELEQLLETLEV